MFTHHPLRGLDIQEFQYEYSIPPEARDVVVALTARYLKKFRSRGALISYQIVDSSGNLALPSGSYEESPRAGTYFYLNVQETNESFMQPTVETISMPPGAEKIIFTGRQWRGGMATTLHDLWIVPLGAEGFVAEEAPALPEFIDRKITRAFKEPWNRRFKDRAPAEPGNENQHNTWSINKEITAIPRGLDAISNSYHLPQPRSASEIKVALICDEFTYNSFAPEFKAIGLEPNTWRQQIEAFEPDLFLCESAWSGINSQTRPWRGRIYGSLKFQNENRTTLFEILKYCKSKNIPTLFWNKEDPTHFGDRVNDFVSTASNFDYILTTAAEVVDEYKRFMPEDRVGIMQFAAQPRTFNPLPNLARSQEAIFAGAWYQVHAERSEMMHKGFDYILSSGRDLAIYDRNFGSKSNDVRFPLEYDSFLHPSVSHLSTASLYRKYALGLNFNTVTDSQTMFARRVFELAASGTLIVSNHSPGIERLYGDNVIYFDRGSDTLDEYTEAEKKQMTMRALETTFSGNTYRHRFEDLLRFIGIQFSTGRPLPTMMVKVGTLAEAEVAITQFQHRSNAFSRLLLVVRDSVGTSQVGTYMTRFGSRMVSVVSESLIRKEDVPVTNFLASPDVVLVDTSAPPTRAEVDTLMLHGEYTHLPIMLSDDQSLGWTARSIKPGMRIAAPDVIGSILQPDSARPTLEVPR